MLIQCPECELQVSDKAVACPHCGYPIQTPTPSRTRKPRQSNKRRRLPNGFGQISEIKGKNLRKPFRAMVTVGKTPTGRPICKPLKPESYFLTYNDAYAALIEYNRNPYDLDNDITLEELYGRWSKEYFKKLKSQSSTRTITAAWAYCSSMYSMNVKDIRARHIKGCMENGFLMDGDKKKYPSLGMKSRIKSLFNLMLDYAVEYEIVDKNYARTFDASSEINNAYKKHRKEHIAFTDDEMETLWRHVDDTAFVDLILIQCYSGWRPQEMGLIKLEDVDLENWMFKGGMKTESGTDRVVPIHSRIRELVRNRYDEAVRIGSNYLINCMDSQAKGAFDMTYNKYRWRFSKAIAALGLNPEHKAHDPRKQFVTMAKKYEVDEYAIKYMVGHAINDITEKIYTQRNSDWLSSEMEKIK